jgi:hypothetical protein
LVVRGAEFASTLEECPNPTNAVDGFNSVGVACR